MKEKKKILIIDDETDMLFVLSQVLMANGYDVSTASNAKDGLQLYESFCPDLILLDRIMPVRSGDDILKTIRKKDCKTPVIFLTAKDSSEDLLEGFGFGANDYIRKPFMMKELLARCNALISLSGQSTDHRILRIGKFSLDTLSNECQFEGQTVAMTNMEFSILALLVENKNNEVSTERIIKSLWNDPDKSSTAKIQVYICKLRKVLQKDPDVKLICLRSVGYKLVEMKR